MAEINTYSWPRYIFTLLTEADMAYNTIVFWILMIIFLGVYLIIPNSKIKKYWILIGSIIFYAWSGTGALIIVLCTALVVYFVTILIDKIYQQYDVEKEGLKPKEQVALFTTYKKKSQKYVVLALFLVIGIWIFVKVAKLFDMQTVESLAEMSIGLGIIIPLGISYYTLSSVGYVMDVYWRKGKAEHNFFDLLSAMIYFPHIMQGPISKYSKIIKQMQELPKVDYDRVCFGLQLMLWGYIKKMVIADRLVMYTGIVFANPKQFAGVEMIIAIFLCVVQLYADFSGCMDIVRGISQVLGIELDRNFRQPFFGKSTQEFWARWHMTLGAWTKEYIYLPIAMNPKFLKCTRQMKKVGKGWLASFLKAFVPLVTVWIFTGLWHGTGLDYLLWGFYWCTLMTLSKEAKPLGDKLIKVLHLETERTYYQVWKMIRTSIFFGIGRTIVITGTLTGGCIVWSQVFKEHRLWTLFDGSLYTYGLDQKDFYVAFVGMGLIFVADILHERGVSIRNGIANQVLPIRWLIYYGAIVIVVILGIYGPGYDAASFVYGAF
ncbi:MAG: MBOAT family O-acyltransferase [Eubacteriales bacterium]